MMSDQRGEIIRYNTPIAILIGVFFSFLIFCQDSIAYQSNEVSESSYLEDIAKGESLYDLGRYDEAIVFFEDALRKNESISESHLKVLLPKMGYVYLQQGNFVSALETCYKNYGFTELGTSERASIDYLLGSIYNDLHAYDRAEEFYLLALNYYSESKSSFEDTINSLLATVYFNQGKHPEALRLFKVLEPTLILERRDSELSSLYNNWGLMLQSKKEHESANKFFSKALQLISGLQDSIRLSGIYHNKGYTHYALSELDSALFSFKLARKLALNDTLGNYRKALYGLSKVYFAKGNSKLGGELLLEYDSLEYVYLNEQKLKETKRFEVLFEVDKYQKDLLVTENERIKQEFIKQILLIILIALFITAATYLYVARQRKNAFKAIAERKEQLANQKINDLLQQQEINSLQGVLAGQEEERQRIATDLHDKLGAILGMVKLHFSAVEERIDDLREDNKQQYDKANALLDQASSEVRNISHNLLSGVLVKFGLIPALRDLKDTVEATGKLRVNLVTGDKMEARLKGEQELQIYRIVQELISNILKHAKASEATIQLNRTNGVINLLVEDNGVGFNVESARQKGGIGLKNLEARAAKLNAGLHFDSGKGAGTTVSVDIPIEEEIL